MDFSKIKLYYHTIRFLKPVQVSYRLIGWLKKKNSFNELNQKFDLSPIIWKGGLKNLSSLDKNNSFIFLNTFKKFDNGKIDWNYSSNGKLWTYNLNYFDFLNQYSIDVNQGIQLINQFIDYSPNHIDGVEPYPISLRSINWVKFLSKNKIINNKINAYLFKDCSFLFNNLEYHILGNHLLENAFSLFFSSYYFQNEKFYAKANLLLKQQLQEQVLDDGGHFELSPMYHKIILTRLLDCIKLINLNPDFKKNNLVDFLIKKAELMCSWLDNITYKSGDVPMVNDTAYGITHSSMEILNYAHSIGIRKVKTQLSDSGYRLVKRSSYELFLDVGNIGPDYQPGHAHSDTFNFELIFKNKPIIVDTGISTYEKNNTRQLQRSTFSHNTVMIGNSEQSEVWGGFRVARRAKVFDLKSFENKISAKHNGYKRKGIIHKRSFELFENEIFIHDFLTKKSNNRAKAIFHFHSKIKKPVIRLNQIKLNDVGINISFHGSTRIELLEYDLCNGFNKYEKAFKLVVNFNKELKTIIYL